MAHLFIVARNVTTTLTRADTAATLNALGNALHNGFRAGGTYDIGADTAWCQWFGDQLNVIIENRNMLAVAASLTTLKATVRSGLLAQSVLTAVAVGDISVEERSGWALE